MPCIRCGRVTVKLCTCSIEQAKDAFSAWSEAELEEAVKTLREVLEAKRSARWRRDITELRQCLSLVPDWRLIVVGGDLEGSYQKR
jgi:hypothetical protein